MNEVTFVLDILSLSFLHHSHLMGVCPPGYSLFSDHPEHPAVVSQLCLGLSTLQLVFLVSQL